MPPDEDARRSAVARTRGLAEGRRLACCLTHALGRRLLSVMAQELHHFRCTHAERTGHLLVTTAHVGFLAYDHSSMFTLPIAEICQVSTARLMSWSASSDNSMRLTMSMTTGPGSPT